MRWRMQRGPLAMLRRLPGTWLGTDQYQPPLLSVVLLRAAPCLLLDQVGPCGLAARRQSPAGRDADHAAAVV